MVRMLIKKIKVIILLAMMFVFNNILFIQAQNNNIQFKDITIEDGLSQSTVEVLYQDSYGYIWIGTNDGLDRYDGYEFKTYKQGDDPSTNIASNYILSIKEDKYKNIWVGTVNGISKINTKENIVTNYFDSNDNGNLSNYNVCDILITKDEEILVATGDGLNLYNYKTDKFERILKGEKTLTSQDIYSMDQDEYGNIWLGTYNGLNKIDIKNNDIKHFYNSSEDENTISENNIYKVYSDKDGNIWVGTFNSGVNKIDIKTGEISRYKNIEGNEDSLPGNFVKSMLRDNKDNMWIATDMGLAKYIEESETFITYNNDLSDRYSLLNDSVFSIMQDMTGLIWIGTYQGISIFDPQNTIEHYKQNPSEKNSLSSNVIHGIYEDESELLWVGTSSDGLNIIDRKNNKIEYITKQDGLSNNSINVIVGDEKYVWVATNEGLNRIDKLTKDIKQYGMNEKLNSFKIKSLYIDSNGLLWVGTDSGINIINIENDEVIDITYVLDDNFIKDKYISDIYEDKKGNYWIGTFKDGGLVKLDTKNNSVKNYRKNDKDKSTISSNSIRTIAEDDQYLWIGTSNGLNKLDKQSEKFTRYTEKDGLNSNTIYGIIVDDDGNPWMSTNHGVSKLDIDKSIFVNYNITDGFQSNEFNGGSHYKNDKGEFFFGGINGFNIFDPLKMDVSSHSSLKVSFDEFIVNGEHHKDINNMKFKQDGNSIIIKFFLPEYKNGNNIYYYKIEGQDKQWNVTKNNEIVYKNLKPGKYTFKIKAINSNGQTKMDPLSRTLEKKSG